MRCLRHPPLAPHVAGKPSPAPFHSFRPAQTVKKASKAAYGLCCWVRAMEAYDR